MSREYHENDSFCIVGIGASAGGLEALQDFLRKCPMTLGRHMS